MNRPLAQVLRTLAVTVLALVAVGCGGTRVKIVNQSGSTYTTIRVQATTGNLFYLDFSNLTTGTTSDAASWDDKDNRTVVISQSGGTSLASGTSQTLDLDKTNIITISSGGAIVRTVE